MKRFLLITVTLIIGIFVGWYLGYTRPLVMYGRNIKAITGMTDAQIIDAYRNSQTMLKSIGEQERTATIISISILGKLEAGDTESSKLALSREIAAYYHVFRKLDTKSPEQAQIIQKIDALSERSPALKEALQRTSS